MDHLLGIGGVGMSALAQTLVCAGRAVSGSDRTLGTPALRRLEAQGVRVFPDDGSGVTAETARVIVSTAIEETNPGLRRARELGIPVVHRAAALAEALSGRRLVAVCGTCGKSSVTAMLGHVLTCCGFDPAVVDGAAVVGWNGAVRWGGGNWAVAEVDESDRSLTAFRPYAAVVTNASADHYSEAEMNAVFDAFVKDVQGPVVDGRGERYAAADFDAQNRSLALRMAVALGADSGAAAAALETFPGVERRLQRTGTCAGAAVYDDYAHNPEKLRALLGALRRRHPRGVGIVWRPHGYGPLRKMMDALAETFREAIAVGARVALLPVYDAGGTADRSVNSDALAARVPGVDLAGDLDEAERALRGWAPGVGALVVAGARDPGLPELAHRLGKGE